MYFCKKQPKADKQMLKIVKQEMVKEEQRGKKIETIQQNS